MGVNGCELWWVGYVWHHIGTKRPVLFTLLSRGEHLAHGTAFSLSIRLTNLCRYQLARLKTAPELPEAFHLGFEFCRRVAPAF
jgi:hypothetical protein